MKTFILLLFVLISDLHSQWYFQTSGVNSYLNDVFFINEYTGFIPESNPFSNQLLKTTNGGNNWIIIATFPENSDIKTIYFVNENTGWAAGPSKVIHSSGQIYKTTNSGINWISQTGVADGYFSDLVFFNENTGFAFGWINFVGLNSIIRKTTDGGNTWTIPGNIGTNSEIRRCSFINSITGWVTVANSKIFKTTNSGFNWFQTYTGTFSNLYSICFLDENTGWLGSNSGIYKSTDGGTSWINQYAGNIQYPTLIFTNALMGWVVGNNGIMIYTYNGGNNWLNYSSGTTSSLVSIFFANSQSGWIVGNNGVILHTDNNGGITGIKQIGSDIPDKFELYQNYPNPFNPKTVIKFNVKRESAVSGSNVKSKIQLVIYNTLGQIVETFVNSGLNAGTYSVEIDGTNFASGAYYYSLIVNDNIIDTKKMLLLK